MTEKEVQEILAEGLMNKDTAEALAASQARIAIEILKKMTNTQTSEKTQKLLKDIILTKNRLGAFLKIRPGSILKTTDAMLQEVVSFYGLWIEVLNFLYENYDGIDSEEFRKRWDRESALEVKNLLAQKYENLRRQLIATGTISIYQQDF